MRVCLSKGDVVRAVNVREHGTGAVEIVFERATLAGSRGAEQTEIAARMTRKEALDLAAALIGVAKAECIVIAPADLDATDFSRRWKDAGGNLEAYGFDKDFNLGALAKLRKGATY